MWLLLCATVLAADPAIPVDRAEMTVLLKTFREEFVQITPGEGKFPASFTMGEEGTTAQPHEVKMGHKFQMAKFEVPQNLWSAVRGGNPSKWKGPRNAVEMLTHGEAVWFCRLATKQMRELKLIAVNEEIRLPSEAEWEYCCRAGTKTRWSFGDDETLLGDYAWFTGNAAGNDPPGGAKKGNPWGLFDLHGEIREWVGDAGNETYQGAPTDGSSWTTGPATKRVLRSGSWKDKPAGTTSGVRLLVPAETRDDAVGFRCVLAEVPTSQPAFTPTAQEKFVPTNAKLELQWGEGEFTEGPAIAPDGSIFFSDIGNTMYRYDRRTNKTAKFRDPSGRSNGLMFTRDGKLVAAEGANSGGKRRISITTGIQGEKDGDVRTLSEGFQRRCFNSPNDLTLTSDGWVYFSDPRYVGDEPRELEIEAIFSVSPTGDASIATRDIEKPNGVILSPDGKRLYASDHNPTGNKQLVAFDVTADHKLVNKQILWDFRVARGIDGMTIDREGNVYATAGTGDKAGIYVFSPAGKPLAMIPTPGDPTNCCFGGGEDAKTLYITAGVSREGKKYGLFRITLNQPGHCVVEMKSGS